MKLLMIKSIGYIVVFFTVFLMLPRLGLAQESFRIPTKIEISEGDYNLSNVSRSGIKTECLGEQKYILKKFKSYLKETYEVKSALKGNLIVAKDQLTAKLSDKHYDLNIQVEDNTLMLWMNLGPDIFVNSSNYPSEFNALKAMTNNFLKEYYSFFLTENLDSQEKELKSVDKLLKKGTKELSTLESSIKKDNAKIESITKKQAKIEESIKKLESKRESNNSTQLELTNTVLENESKKEQTLEENEIINENRTQTIELIQEINNSINTLKTL